MDLSPDAVALRYLRYLALRDGGYTRLGVAGWALREDVERATRLRLPERLPVLHGRGLVDREDVRAPGLSRPAWIYRVTQAGADRAAEQADLPRRAVLRPLRPAERDADAAIHIPAGAALALQELRRALERRVESPFLPGETGWRTMAELRLQSDGEDRARPRWEPRTRRGAWEESDEVERGEAADLPAEPWMGDGDWMGRAVREEREEGWDPLFGDMPPAPAEHTPWPADLEWLVRAGLAQKWIAHQPDRRAVPLYRITALGGVAIRLEWREPR